ncbi:MAG: hypothetical protein QM770_00935 [Tepidisphaeraceae bacterium]
MQVRLHRVVATLGDDAAVPGGIELVDHHAAEARQGAHFVGDDLRQRLHACCHFQLGDARSQAAL